MNRRSLLKMMMWLPWAFGETQPTRFAVIGDWGAGNTTQRRVAKAMLALHHRSPFSAVISTGDNIYPKGVQSTTDEHWQKYTAVYDQSLRDIPWYVSLGNHDWRGDIQAQINYGNTHQHWHLPHRYYHKQLTIQKRKKDIVVIDTTALLKGDNDQVSWLKQLMPQLHRPWVVGHHSLRSYGYYGDNRVLLSLLQEMFNQAEVELYLCGHDHDLQHIKHPDDTFHCIVSGAGASTRETALGKYSLFGQATAGFAVIDCVDSTTTVSFFDQSVSLLHKRVLFS